MNAASTGNASTEFTVIYPCPNNSLPRGAEQEKGLKLDLENRQILQSCNAGGGRYVFCGLAGMQKLKGVKKVLNGDDAW